MAFASGDVLSDGWRVERATPDGSIRFTRAPSIDRKRAVGRLIVMGGCLAVTLALAGVTAQSTEALWLISWSLIALFAVTALLALAAAVKDLSRSSLGVFLEIDARQGLVRGVTDGAGLICQFTVGRSEAPLATVQLRAVSFEDRHDGSGMITCTLGSGARLLAPDVPRVDDATAWLASLPKA
jgi:hypothetical protein